MSEYNIKRDLDKVMAIEVPNKPTSLVEELKIDEDTSFNIYYDIYNDENTDYLYIKMIEKTAKAPFYYNRSFTIEELQELDKSFKSCSLKDVKEHIKFLFSKNKIKLFYENDKDIIKMEINIILFEDNYNIYFKLFREMIPEEMKDEELLNLYEIEKKKIKMIKELASIFNSFSNQEEKALGEKLRKLIFQFEIPGIEKDLLNFGEKAQPEKININESRISDEEEIKIEDVHLSNKTDDTNLSTDSKKKDDIISNNNTNYNIFINARKPNKKYHLNEGKNTIDLILKNITDEDWPMNDIKLVCNEETSTIKCTVGEFIYDIEKGQDCEIKLIFHPNDLTPGEYQCNLELFLRGKKVKDGFVSLCIKVGKKKDK